MGGAALAQTLSEAIALGLGNSPRISVAQSNLELAREQRVGAGAAGRMRVQVEGTVSQRYEQSDTLNFMNRPVESTASQQRNAVGVTLSQPVYTGGRLSTNIALSNTRISAAQIALAESEVLAARNIAASYAELVRAELSADILQTSVSALSQDVAGANARFRAGEVSLTDVAQSEARLASAQGQLARALSDLAAARANFERFVGVAPRNIDANLPQPIIPATQIEFVDAVMANNFGLQSARARYETAQAAVRAASTARNPSVTIDAGVDRRWNEAYPGADAASQRIAARVVVPLWDGGAASSGVRQAIAQASVARYQLADLEFETRANISRAWANREATRAVLEAANRQVASAEVARRGAVAELRFGLRSTIEALNQEVELRQALIGQASARRDDYIALVDIAALMGVSPLGELPPSLDPKKRSVIVPPPPPKPLLIERPIYSVLEFLESNDRPLASTMRNLNQALEPRQVMGPLP